MKIESLQYLLSIDKHHSISSAAKDLFMGQPALSSALKSIERDLGFQIFERKPSGVVPTARGKKAISLAKEILLQYGNAIALASEAMLPEPVYVVLSQSFASFLPLRLHPVFSKQYPDLPLKFFTISRNQVFSTIVHNGAQIGATHLMNEEIEELRTTAKRYHIQMQLCHKDLFMLAVNQSFVTPSKEEKPEYFHNLELATVDGFVTVSFYNALTSVFESFSRYTSFPDVQQAVEAVRRYGMCAVLTESVCHGLNLCEDPDLNIIPLQDIFSKSSSGFSIDCYLLHREYEYLRGSERLLVEEILKTLKE